MTQTASQVILSKNPIEYSRLEELSGNFSSEVVSPNTWTPGPGLAERIVNGGVCNCVRGQAIGDVNNVIIVGNGRTLGTVGAAAGEGFSFFQMVNVNTPNENNCLIHAVHGGDNTGIYGLGVMVFNNGIQLRLHGMDYINGTFALGYFSDPISRYIGPELTANEWHSVGVKVQVHTIGLGFTYNKIKLYLDGIYCGNLSGTYNEFNKEIGVAFGAWHPPFAGIISQTNYGRQVFHINISWLYGDAYIGLIDEPAWFDYELEDNDFLEMHQACMATINASPIGVFNSIKDSYKPRETIYLRWGKATNATGYLIEKEVNGVLSEIGISTENVYFYSIPSIVSDIQMRFKITALFGSENYVPENCVNASIYSNMTSILGSSSRTSVSNNCGLIIPSFASTGSSCGDNETVHVNDEESITPTLSDCP